VKVLVILATVTFIGHFGHAFHWWKLCAVEFAFEQPVASHYATHKLMFAGGNLWHLAVQTEVHTR